MYKILVVLVILFNVTVAWANSFNTISTSNSNGFNSKLRMNQPKTIISTYEGSRRQNRLHPHYCPQCHYNNPYLSRNDLNALEKYALDKTYRRENDLQRLERLENLAFGATQSGNLYSRFKNVENAILSRPQYKTKNSFA